MTLIEIGNSIKIIVKNASFQNMIHLIQRFNQIFQDTAQIRLQNIITFLFQTEDQFTVVFTYSFSGSQIFGHLSCIKRAIC